VKYKFSFCKFEAKYEFSFANDMIVIDAKGLCSGLRGKTGQEIRNSYWDVRSSDDGVIKSNVSSDSGGEGPSRCLWSTKVVVIVEQVGITGARAVGDGLYLAAVEGGKAEVETMEAVGARTVVVWDINVNMDVDVATRVVGCTVKAKISVEISTAKGSVAAK
jgi:hypothetical protein